MPLDKVFLRDFLFLPRRMICALLRNPFVHKDNALRAEKTRRHSEQISYIVSNVLFPSSSMGFLWLARTSRRDWDSKVRRGLYYTSLNVAYPRCCDCRRISYRIYDVYWKIENHLSQERDPEIRKFERRDWRNTLLHEMKYICFVYWKFL